jgi:hypothetical protein
LIHDTLEVVDGENTSLDAQFATLMAILLDKSLREEVNSIDLQDATLPKLHRQTNYFGERYYISGNSRLELIA